MPATPSGLQHHDFHVVQVLPVHTQIARPVAKSAVH